MRRVIRIVNRYMHYACTRFSARAAAVKGVHFPACEVIVLDSRRADASVCADYAFVGEV